MDNTKVQVFLLPSDSGNRSVGSGGGPEHFVNNGLASVLESNGHEVSLESIEL